MKKSKEKLEKYLEIKENGNTTYQNIWDTAKAILTGMYSETDLLQETRKLSSNLTLYLKELERE